MNNKIIMIALIFTALNANAQNVNNCDSTCLGNPALINGLVQSTNVTTNMQPQLSTSFSSLQNSSATMREVVVAGGNCLGFFVNYWNGQDDTWGGARCSGSSASNFRNLICPSGTNTKITLTLRNSGYGGTSGFCTTP